MEELTSISRAQKFFSVFDVSRNTVVVPGEHLRCLHIIRQMKSQSVLYFEHLEIMHPVDDVEEGEGEGEEDPGKAVDLRRRVE